MIRRDDWLPMIVETAGQRQQREELFLVYAGPLIALICFGVVLSYAVRALG
jgi:hypothetical protein